MISPLLVVLCICYIGNCGRMPNPTNFNGVDILPFDQNQQLARQYAKRMCMAWWDFFSSDSKRGLADNRRAFDQIFGERNELLSENIECADFGEPALVGFKKNRKRAMVTREIMSYSIPDDVNDDDPCHLNNLIIGPYSFQYSVKRKYSLSATEGILWDPQTIVRSTSAYYFDTNGLVERFLTSTDTTNAKSNFRTLMDLSLTASSTVYDAAVYLNLIEREMEDANESIIIIKQIFYTILIVIALLFGGIIAFLIKCAFWSNNTTKYRQVSSKTELTDTDF